MYVTAVQQIYYFLHVHRTVYSSGKVVVMAFKPHLCTRNHSSGLQKAALSCSTVIISVTARPLHLLVFAVDASVLLLIDSLHALLCYPFATSEHT